MDKVSSLGALGGTRHRHAIYAPKSPFGHTDSDAFSKSVVMYHVSKALLICCSNDIHPAQ